ncbi:probable serine/threonine-protein kinase tsuA isoform X3 [Condylostylus longicornis]|uniref:probable serine/threonine-protein kinase tsuA isoform X3 n=1 Tax=Condylostylus longicornis TaxID=2530218 RepID=UPI00244E4C2A|nr:probable serine/threonine-protein kinase tsuA isoform X3 [Condylostylus longicornis]
MCTTEKSPSKMANTITNVIRNVVSKQRKRYVANGYDLDLSYICDNIIAMGYPAANIEKWYRNHIDDVVKFLEENHKDHYKIYNLCSERNYDISTFHGRVAVFPFADHNPPTIELMQKFCDDINSWLKGDERNVAAVHCKAGKGRTGTMICCYLLQCGFARTADEALSYYDEKRTKDKKGVTIPSQRRYVEYYAKLLTSGKPYERRTLQICEIRFSSPPLSSSQGTVLSLSTLDDPSCPDKVKTLQNFAIDFRKTSNVEITDRCIPVTGDVRIELSHKVTKKTMLHLWFNVYFIDEEGERHGHGDDTKIIYEFKKNEIDDAHKDKENKTFAEDFSVQLVFQTIPSRNSYVNACGDKTDNLVMNTSVHSNYDHNNHCGNIYNNSALSGGNYIVDNVSTGHHSQMDIQPVIEPLKQQNHNNSSNSINNTNLAIRQQQHQRQQQQEQYAFPTNQNQYKQQQNRNMNSVGPMNINSITSSPPAPGTQNSSNNSTISVKNKNLSLKLSSSLVISPQKQQQQQQRTQQEQQSQLSQTLHEKQQQILHHQQQQNSKNNLKHPGKLSKQQLQQQYLEQPSSNKSMAISSNQQHLQQQHESRTNSTSSNTSKSSSNSSSSISISSAASSSACIGEDWESENQQNILPIEEEDLATGFKSHSTGVNSSYNVNNLVIIDDSDSDEVFLSDKVSIVTKTISTVSSINKTSSKIKNNLDDFRIEGIIEENYKDEKIKIKCELSNKEEGITTSDCDIDQIKNENIELHNSEKWFQDNQNLQIEPDTNKSQSQHDVIFEDEEEKSQASVNLLQRRFSKNFPSNSNLGMKAILKNLKLNYRRGST